MKVIGIRATSRQSDFVDYIYGPEMLND